MSPVSPLTSAASPMFSLCAGLIFSISGSVSCKCVFLCYIIVGKHLSMRETAMVSISSMGRTSEQCDTALCLTDILIACSGPACRLGQIV
jgi:hypothetical protein